VVAGEWVGLICRTLACPEGVLFVWDAAAPGQMQFYDDKAVVDRAAGAVARFFDAI
jgi:hypothetical protein